MVQSNHVHCCVSQAKQLSGKGHRHRSSFVEKFGKDTFALHSSDFQILFFLFIYSYFISVFEMQPILCTDTCACFCLLDLPFHFVPPSGTIFLAVQLLGA